MPLTAEIDRSTNTVIFDLSAPTATVGDLLLEYRKILGAGEVVTNMHAIWDVSRLDLKSIPLAEIRRLPREMGGAILERGNDFKVAIVASRAGDQMLLRLYLSVIKLIGRLHFRLFTSQTAARAWIAQP
jgi:hypothetical protein